VRHSSPSLLLSPGFSALLENLPTPSEDKDDATSLRPASSHSFALARDHGES